MDSPHLLGRLSPPVTRMIRMDHSHVLVLSHQFTSGASPDKKKSIAEAICLALEIHARLEEEIFYPALREVDGGNEVLARAQPEHDEMRRLIDVLRTIGPTDVHYDATFHQLMRNVTHHVADEEAVLLPAAERLLGDRLGELGVQMTRRRLQLAGPHAGQLAVAHARTMPAATMLMAGGLLAGAWWLGRRGLKHYQHRHH
jgi:hemerythrin superfamily protein